MKIAHVFLLISLMFILVISACSSQQTSDPSGDDSDLEQGKNNESELNLPNTISIGTGPVGGSFHVVGSGFASFVSDHTPMRGIVQPSSGMTGFIPELNDGQLDFGIIDSMHAFWSYNALGDYDENKNIRVVFAGNLIPNIGFVIRKDRGETLNDIVGQRIGGEYADDTVLTNQARANILAAGLSMDDFISMPVSVFIEGLDALQNGQLSATLGGGTNTPRTMEVDAAVGLNVPSFGNLKPEDIKNGIPENIKKIMDEYIPGATLAVIPAGTGILKQDTVLASFYLTIAASTHTSSDVVYTILKALWEHDEAMQAVHVWFDGWTKNDMMFPELPAPYHDGAVKFYKEVGLWTEKHQQVQDQLLKE